MRLRRETGWMLCGCIAMLQTTIAFGDAIPSERPTDDTIVTTYSGLGVAELYIAPNLPDGWSAVAPAVLGVTDLVTFPVDGSFDIQTDQDGAGAIIVGGYFTMAGPAVSLVGPNGDLIDLDDLGVTFTQSGRAVITFGSLFGPRYGRPSMSLDGTSTEMSEDFVLTLESPVSLEARFAQALGIDTRSGDRVGYLRVVLDDLVVDPHGSETLIDGSGSGDEPIADGFGPDVFTWDIGGGLQKYGTVGGITGYAMATTSCNQGDEWAEWFSGSANHPLVAQNLYRINNKGDFEQIGMSWLKHTWCAADFFACTGGSGNGTCNWMTIGIADVYSQGLNGQQSDLGPRSEVNAAMGSYPYPYGIGWNASGNATYKRLQVHESDLAPAQNPGATYLADAHYLATDEAADHPLSGSQYNNATWKLVNVGGLSNGYALGFTGAKHMMEAGIEAWPQLETDVSLETVFVPDETGGAPDGKLIVGTRVTSNGDGTWHYAYAVYNMTSDRSVGAVTVPLPDDGVGVTNVNFHDVDYHSGEPYSLADWTSTETSTSCRWATQSFADNQNANAIRWATTYSFQFDSDSPPYRTSIVLDMFKPGTPLTIGVSSMGPAADCDGNDVADQEDINNDPSLDLDGNGILDVCESMSATLIATSARQLEIFPIGTSEPFTMLLTGDSENPAISCFAGFIQPDGTLGMTPVAQTALQWGAILVEDAGIIPNGLYTVSFDPPLVDPLAVTTDLWSDVNDSGTVNLEDAFLVVLGFMDPDNSDFTIEQMDVDPACDGGNGAINLGDVQRVVLTWQGETWLDICAAPCGP